MASERRVIQACSGYHGDPNPEPAGYHFWCPGCEMHHMVCTRLWREGGNPVWSFNGSIDKPTFGPSILATIQHEPRKICHSFIVDGRIQFLGDCWHSLAGTTVDLSDLSEWPY